MRRYRRRNPISGKNLAVAVGVGVTVYALAQSLETTGSEEGDAIMKFVREHPGTSALLAGGTVMTYLVAPK